MLIPKWVRAWIPVAGTALVLGGAAWLAKLGVVVSTGGRVTVTGAAGAFFTLGLVLILIGSTGVGLRLAMNGETTSQIVGTVLSPIMFVAAFMVLQGIVVGFLTVAQAVFGVLRPDYVRGEAIILLTALASLVVGAVVRGEAHFGPEVADRIMGFFSAPRVAPPSEAFPDLTSREAEILDLIAHGMSNQEIVRRLFLSAKTVRNHVSNVFLKLQVADRSQAMVRAREAGLGREGR